MLHQPEMVFRLHPLWRKGHAKVDVSAHATILEMRRSGRAAPWPMPPLLRRLPAGAFRGPSGVDSGSVRRGFGPGVIKHVFHIAGARAALLKEKPFFFNKEWLK